MDENHEVPLKTKVRVRIRKVALRHTPSILMTIISAWCGLEAQDSGLLSVSRLGQFEVSVQLQFEVLVKQSHVPQNGVLN